MKTMSLICAGLALGMPALAAAQRGGGAGAAGVQRIDVQRVQRIDPGRTITPSRDLDIRRGDFVGGETGTRIRRRDDDPNRRRLHDPARRRWNAAHPTVPDPSRRPAGR